MPETREEVENSRARWAHRAATAELNRDYLYEKLRKLENRIRDTIVIGDHIDTDKLYSLRVMVPAQPRKTLRELRKRR